MNFTVVEKTSSLSGGHAATHLIASLSAFPLVVGSIN